MEDEIANGGHYQAPHFQTVEMEVQKDTYRPALEQSRGTINLHSSNRHQISYRGDTDNPMARFETLEREIKELREYREHQVLNSNEKIKPREQKARSSSPRFEREHFSKRIDTVEFSPQFKSNKEQDDSMRRLEDQKKSLKNELKQLMGLEESKNYGSKRFEESFSGLKISEIEKDNLPFDQILDKYAEKLLRAKALSKNDVLPSAGKLKYEDILHSETKKTNDKPQESIGRNLFKLDSPVHEKKDVRKNLDVEELS